MKTVILSRPRFQSACNSLKRGNARNVWSRLILFGTLGVIFWSGSFILFYRVLRYFHSVQDFGDLLAMKLLSMIMVTFFMLLIFSNLINCLSHLYLSHDLELLHALPVSATDIYLSRWMMSSLDSSWMILAFSLPIFISYGLIYKASLFYYAFSLTAVMSMCFMVSALCGCVVLMAASLLPAGRLRTIILASGIALGIILIVALRLLQPEQLVNPEKFASAVLFLNALGTPQSPLLPTTWLTETVTFAMRHDLRSASLNLFFSITFSLMFYFLNNILSEKFYFFGFSKSQLTPSRFFSPLRHTKFNWENCFRFLPRESKAFVIKEIRTFFRDSTQWPQLFLIIALIIIYLYNFSVLPVNLPPVKTFSLQNLFSFLNIGLVTSVLAAIAARFVFPSISLEGKAFWIVQAAPMPVGRILWIKFFLYYIPLAILANLLTIASNLLLQVSPFMMVLSVATIFLLTPAIVSLAIGLGAVHADFQSENPSNVITGFGGLLFMILSFFLIALVLALEAGPVYQIFMAGFRRQNLTFLQNIWTVFSFGVVFFLCILATLLPIHYGKRHLDILRFPERRRGL